MSSTFGTLYVGVTNDLERRVSEHKGHTGSAFTAKYDVTRRVYYETTIDIREALAREKQIKGWTRVRKVRLIKTLNPECRDLAAHLDRRIGDPSLRSG